MRKKPNLLQRIKKEHWIILGILILAAFIRLYLITSIPTGFHRDEALFGYNAYSILQTARDEHGRFLPMAFEGFGVWDYPLVIYLRVPFIALLGLNVFSVRFSLVFFSIITLFLLYKFTKNLFLDTATAVIGTLVGAFSTWHFFMSRSGYSIAMIALVFLLLGVNLLFFGKKKQYKVLGGISLGLTLFCYAAYYFFLPLFLLVIFFVYFDEIKKDKNLRFGFIAAVLTGAIAFGLYWNLNLKRAPQSAFYYDRRNIEFGWADKPVGEIFAQGGKYSIWEKILHYPRLGFVYKAATNYFEGFSPTFWLETGRGFESNVSGFGNLLLYEPILIIVGALYLLWKRSKVGIFLVGWILAGPVATTFTKDVASTRLLHMVVPFVILEAVAIKFLFLELAVKLKPTGLRFVILCFFLAPILFLNILYFDSYFRHMSAYSGRWWFKGIFDVVDITNKYPEKQIYFQGSGDFNYILVLFRSKYDPATFQKEALRRTSELNLSPVLDFGRYHFPETLDRQMVCRDYNSIYIVRLEGSPVPPFTPDGEITSLGSDHFVFFLPTEEKCNRASN